MLFVIKVEGVISGLNSTILDRKERKTKEKILAKYFVRNINIHNVWAAKMFIVEVIYFINILANIYLMDVFLGKSYAAIYVNGYLILLLKRWRVLYLWSPSSHNYGARSRRSC